MSHLPTLVPTAGRPSPTPSSTSTSTLVSAKSVRFAEKDTTIQRARTPSPVSFTSPAAPSEAMMKALRGGWNALQSLTTKEKEACATVDKVAWLIVQWGLTNAAMEVEKDDFSNYITVGRVFEVLDDFLREKILLSSSEMKALSQQDQVRAVEECQRRLATSKRDKSPYIEAIMRWDFAAGTRLQGINVGEDDSWRLVIKRK